MARRKSFPRIVHWLFALVLLPLLYAVIRQTGLMLPVVMEEGLRAWGLYVAGIATYVVFERFVTKPMWLYVFGHEMTHVLSGFMSGAKVHSFKAKSTGGEVRLSKSNAFIALSPYIVPLYALGAVLIYVITRRWWNPPQLFPVFQFVLGLALAFHISLTISAIHKHQPDLKVLGHFLSGVLIILGNVLIVAVMVISLFPKAPTYKNYFRMVGVDTSTAYRFIGQTSFRGGMAAHKYLKEHVKWTR